MSQVKTAREINRAKVVDQAFRERVKQMTGDGERQLPFDEATFWRLFDAQLYSRQLDLMARELRLQNRVFYTIGSAGHEGNALVGELTRVNDPALLHYRSGALVMARSMKDASIDPIADAALSFAAAASDPASGGRHKVWGSKRLQIIPQTSTIASHLPKAVGMALAIEECRRLDCGGDVPADAIAICSFGDASVNHATAQTAFNAAQWAAHQGLPTPILFVCEDNGIGISVKTPTDWIMRSFADRTGLAYFAADGLDFANGYDEVAAAIAHCRHKRRPTFLHLKTVRLLGHAGTDVELDYLGQDEVAANEARDPLLSSAQLAVTAGFATGDGILARYEQIRERCFAAADEADKAAKLTTLASVQAPLAPLSLNSVMAKACAVGNAKQRIEHYGSLKGLPENAPPKHLAVLINQGLRELMLNYDRAHLFGEDVARKGGVYTVTKKLQTLFGRKRVFNTLLDETTILGMAQGFGAMGLLPIPEIQYLAYFHNAADQIRGEACSLQFFSNDQFRNPMLLRIAGLGYQKGFGGHFHNDNSITALRDIPALVLACPSRGDDAVAMLSTLAAMADSDGRVVACLEPIALYMRKDLHEPGDGLWQFTFPEPGQAIEPGQARIYDEDHRDLLIITYGNGVPMSLQARKTLAAEGFRIRVMDLRWLVPLNAQTIVEHAAECDRVLIFDEGRASGGVAEGVMAALVEGRVADRPIARVTGADCYTPLADAANLVLPQVVDIEAQARQLLDAS